MNKNNQLFFRIFMFIAEVKNLARKHRENDDLATASERSGSAP